MIDVHAATMNSAVRTGLQLLDCGSRPTPKHGRSCGIETLVRGWQRCSMTAGRVIKPVNHERAARYPRTTDGPKASVHQFRTTEAADFFGRLSDEADTVLLYTPSRVDNEGHEEVGSGILTDHWRGLVAFGHNDVVCVTKASVFAGRTRSHEGAHVNG
jgi:hypothetical protein